MSERRIGQINALEQARIKPYELDVADVERVLKQLRDAQAAINDAHWFLARYKAVLEVRLHQERKKWREEGSVRPRSE